MFFCCTLIFTPHNISMKSGYRLSKHEVRGSSSIKNNPTSKTRFSNLNTTPSCGIQIRKSCYTKVSSALGEIFHMEHFKNSDWNFYCLKVEINHTFEKQKFSQSIKIFLLGIFHLVEECKMWQWKQYGINSDTKYVPIQREKKGNYWWRSCILFPIT